MISQPDSSNFSKNSAELSIIIKRTETPPSPLCVFLDLVAGHIESHQVGLAGLVSLNGGHIDGAYRAADIQLRLIGLVIGVLPDDHSRFNLLGDANSRLSLLNPNAAIRGWLTISVTDFIAQERSVQPVAPLIVALAQDGQNPRLAAQDSNQIIL